MQPTRRTAITALIGIGGGTALYCAALDVSAWRAYEAVEDAWIRERHALLVAQRPECAEAAGMDMDLKLAELQRRAIQFQYLSKHNPRQLRGGMWQLAWIPLRAEELARITAASLEYRAQDEKIRSLTEGLRSHRRFGEFHDAQTRLWRTADYRFAHRRYSVRLQELNRIYGVPESGSL